MNAHNTQRYLTVMILCLNTLALHPTGSTQSKENEIIRYSGSITTRSGHTFCITNIKLGRDEPAASTTGLSLIMAPTQRPEPSTISGKNAKGFVKKELILEEDPNTITKRIFSLGEMRQIQLHEPDTVWTYKRKDATLIYDYAELDVTYDDSMGNKLQERFLVELGVRGTRNPLKVFYTRINKKAHGAMRKKTRKKNKPPTCPDVKHTGSTWNTPLADVKKLVIDGPCMKRPETPPGHEPHAPAHSHRTPRWDDDNMREKARYY